MKTQNSPCAENAQKNSQVIFSKIKSTVEKLPSINANNNNSDELLDGFLAFNKNFKKQRCSEKANEAFDVELSEFNESNFISSTEDLGFGLLSEFERQEYWA